MKSKVYVLLFLIFLLKPDSTFSQEASLRLERLNEIPTNDVVIVNDNDVDLVFDLRFPGNNWYPFKIKSRKSKSYGLKDYYEMHIKMCTKKRGCVEYRLRGNRRYSLEYNNRTDRWDVLELVE